MRTATITFWSTAGIAAFSMMASAAFAGAMQEENSEQTAATDASAVGASPVFKRSTEEELAMIELPALRTELLRMAEEDQVARKHGT